LEVVLTREHGFCIGVSKAVELAKKAAGKARASGRTAWTLGPLIHNQRVVLALQSLGVRTAPALDDIPSGDIVILPSHGAGPELVAEAGRRGITVVDATCALVRKVQTAARTLREEGYRVVVVGQPDHTEVKSVVAWCGGEAVVVETAEEAAALPEAERTAVVAQTTQRAERVERVAEALRARGGEVRVEPTLCHVTSQRQDETRALAGRVDVLVVVGGRESANTQKLAEIGREAGCRVHHVEGADEIEPSWFSHGDRIGVAAGTSTPDWITEEVVARMEEIKADRVTQPQQEEAAPSEASREEPRSSEAETVQPVAVGEVRRGDRVQGTVVKIDGNEVLVDIGYKTEGILPLSETSRRNNIESPAEVFKEGDVVEALVIRIDDEGRPILSRKRIEEDLAWARLREAHEKGLTLDVPVTAQVKGGLVADVGTRGFIPASQVGLEFVKDLSPYVGKTLRVKVIEANRDEKRAILSEKKALEEERDNERARLLSTIEEGESRTGEVKRVTEYGAFVDIGGLDGLLHVSEMSWRRVADPRQLVKEGDKVEVRVLKIDRERGRVSLGLKQTEPDPWSKVATKYPVGQVVSGKVVSVTDFGAFVELEEGIEGLVHVSQLSDKRVAHPSEVVKVGDTVSVKVLKVNPAERRISLSARGAEQELDRRQIKQYLKAAREDSVVTIGDMVGDLLQGRELGDGKDEPGKE